MMATAMPLLFTLTVTVVPGQASAQEIGMVSLHGAAVRGLEPNDGTLRGGLRADLSFVIDRFSLGPELGIYFTGPKSVSPNPDRGENVITAAGVTRFRFADGPWRPFVVGGLGVYGWESNRIGYATGTYFSGSLGVGLLHSLSASGTGLSGEVRLHQQLTGSPNNISRRFLTVTAGITVGW